MGKNVAVFVDVANIFYAAKAAGVDIDYVTLLKSASAGRDLVRAYAYTGLDPENENQRNFHSFLARHGYKVVSKDIRKYGDGKVKANLDIELVVDMMKTARNLDIAIVVSGDGDFAPAIRAVQEMGVRVEVISFRGNTSSDLIDVADQFTDIIHLAKVEKGSSRSGRRVAGDDEDLSMTEVPDKQTEGSGGRTRGRGRGRGRAEEPVAARAGRRTAVPAAAAAASAAPLVVLPGEKLSRVTPAAALAAAEALDQPERAAGEVADESIETTADAPGIRDGESAEEAGRRRRRRRGGRGRGRGRGRAEGELEASATEARPVPEDEEEEEAFVEAPRGPRTTPFGSVWDSQIGVPSQVPSRLEPLPDDEDLEEPEIPEYLIAERRNRGRAPGGAGRGGARGGRGSYAAAMERERYGRGGGGGINRYPDVSGRERPRDAGFVRSDRPRQDRVRPDRDRPERAAARGGGSEPWSEVPPELEAMLRAQLSTGRPREAARPSGPPQPRPEVRPVGESVESIESTAGPMTAADSRSRSVRPSRGRARPSVDATSADATSLFEPAEPASVVDAVAASVTGIADETAPPKRRTVRRKTTESDATTEVATEGAATPKRRSTRRKPTTEDGGAAATEADATAEAPKRRVMRRTTTAADAAAAPAVKRRSPRRATSSETPAS